MNFNANQVTYRVIYTVYVLICVSLTIIQINNQQYKTAVTFNTLCFLIFDYVFKPILVSFLVRLFKRYNLVS